MKAKILVLALLLGWASTANAWTWLDDPAQTSGVTTDKMMLASGADPNAAATTSATQSSAGFDSQGRTYTMVTFDVTACSTCNFTFSFDMMDNDGTFYNYTAQAAITATGKYRYMLGCVGGSAGSAGGCYIGDTGIPVTASNKTTPGYFRVTVTRSAGSATYTVTGATW